MRTILSVIFALFALPVAAAELECTNEPTQPATAFVQVATERHPDLNEGQVADIARLYELESVAHVMEGVVNFFPDTAALAYVERLNY